MKPLPNERFWSSTQGRIVTMLRGGTRTVNELARPLELSDNAVRAHLTALERDGLVQHAGSRKGIRKPNLTYALTPDAGHLFPKEYAVILGHLLAVLKERHPPEAVDELVRTVGRRMALDYRATVAAGGAADRPGHALAMLRDLGGFCRSEERDGAVLLSCSDCPLGAIVAAHPEVCRLVETMLADALGAPVRERCQPPRCVFELTAAAE